MLVYPKSILIVRLEHISNWYLHGVVVEGYGAKESPVAVRFATNLKKPLSAECYCTPV